MALVRKFEPGGEVQESVARPTSEKNLEWDNGTFNLKDFIKALANANRDGYLFTNELFDAALSAIKDGRATRNANGSWSFTDAPQLDNQSGIQAYGKSLNGEKVGYNGVNSYTGELQKSHGIFTDKDSKSERLRYHQLGHLAAFLNAVLASQTDVSSNEEEKKEEAKKDGRNYFLDALTRQYLTDSKDNLLANSTFADLDKALRVKGMRDVLLALSLNTNYDAYDWSGTPFDTEDALKAAIVSSIGALDNDVLNGNYQNWKFDSIKDYLTYEDPNEEADETDPFSIYADENMREAVRQQALANQYKAQLDAAIEVWKQLKSAFEDNAWNHHFDMINRNFKSDLITLGNTDGDYDFVEDNYNIARKSLESFCNAAKVNNLENYNKETAVKLEKNFKYMYKTMEYLKNSLPDQYNAKFPEIELDGLTYNAIMGAASTNGFFWVFRKNPNGLLQVKMAHASQFPNHLLTPDETMLDNYKKGYIGMISKDYEQKYPIPTMESLNIPIQKEGGTIEKKFEGGALANKSKIRTSQEINSIKKQQAIDGLPNRRVVRQDGLWVEPGWLDIARLTAVGGDIVSIFGGFTGLGGGSYSTIANAIADYNDKGISTSEATANMLINAGLTAVSAIPGMGVFKAARGLKGLVKFVPWIIGTVSTIGAVSNLPEMKKAWGNIISGNYDSRDIQLAGQSIVLATSAYKGLKTNVQARRVGRSANLETTTTIRTKSGKNIPINKEQLEALETVFKESKGDYAKVNEKLRSFGGDFANEEMLVGTYNGKYFTGMSKLPFRQERTPKTAKISTSTTGKVGDAYEYDGKLYKTDPILRMLQNWDTEGIHYGRFLSGRSIGDAPVRTKPSNSPKPAAKPEAKPTAKAEGKAEVKPEGKAEGKADVKPEASGEGKAETKKLGGSFNFAVKALNGTRLVRKADDGMKTIPEWFMNLYGHNITNMPSDYLPNYNKRAAVSIRNGIADTTLNIDTGDHKEFNIDNRFRLNQEYTAESNYGNREADLNSALKYYTGYDPTSNIDVGKWLEQQYNADMLRTREYQGVDRDYNTRDAQDNNTRFKRMFASRSKRLGYDQDQEKIYGPHSYQRIGDAYAEEYGLDLNEADFLNRTFKYTVDGKDYYYGKKANGDIMLLDDELLKRYNTLKNPTPANPVPVDPLADPNVQPPAPGTKAAPAANQPADNGPTTINPALLVQQDVGDKNLLKGNYRLDNAIGLARVPLITNANVRAYRAALEWFPAMRDYMHRLEVHEGDYNALKTAEHSAAEAMSKASRTFTNDASLQLLGNLDAQSMAAKYIATGAAQDASRYFDTRHRVTDLANKDIEYNTGVHDYNSASRSEYSKFKAQSKANLILNNAQAWDNWLASVQQQLASGYDRQWQLSLESAKSALDANQKMRLYAMQQLIKAHPDQAPKYAQLYVLDNIKDQQNYYLTNYDLVGPHLFKNPTTKVNYVPGDHVKNKWGLWQVMGEDGTWKLDPTYSAYYKKGGVVSNHDKERIQSAKDFNAAQRENLKDFHRNYRARIRKRNGK